MAGGERKIAGKGLDGPCLRLSNSSSKYTRNDRQQTLRHDLRSPFRIGEPSPVLTYIRLTVRSVQPHKHAMGKAGGTGRRTAANACLCDYRPVHSLCKVISARTPGGISWTGNRRWGLWHGIHAHKRSGTAVATRYACLEDGYLLRTRGEIGECHGCNTQGACVRPKHLERSRIKSRCHVVRPAGNHHLHERSSDGGGHSRSCENAGEGHGEETSRGPKDRFVTFHRSWLNCSTWARGTIQHVSRQSEFDAAVLTRNCAQKECHHWVLPSIDEHRVHLVKRKIIQARGTPLE